MTLTTETITLWRNNAEITAGETAEDDPEHIAAKAILALTAELLANREAQPVGYIDPDSLKEYRGQRAGGTWSAVQRTTSGLNMTTPIYTAPPAPAYPERLPCPVHLLPGLKFGKGVPTRSMLDALVRRAEYEAELDAMTPEQKAENDERLEKLKALIPLPAPSAAGELLEAMEEVIRISDRDHEAWDKAKAAISACRAAMLAQPVSSGYTLPDGWIACSERMPDADGAYWCWFGKEKSSVIQQRVCIWNDRNHEWCDSAVTHWMPLPAAPEGGNG